VDVVGVVDDVIFVVVVDVEMFFVVIDVGSDLQLYI